MEMVLYIFATNQEILIEKRFLNLKETKNFKIIDTPSISVTY